MTNLAAWFRKGVGQTDAGAGACSAWADQSGNGRNITQATGARRPTIQPDGTLVFTNHYLKTTSGFTLNQPFTVSLRLKVVAWTSAGRVFDGMLGNDGMVYMNPSTPSLRMYAGSNGPVSTGATVGEWVSLVAVFNGASSTLRIGASTTAASTPGAANPGGFTLGADAGGANPVSIEAAEALVYAAALSGPEQDQLVAYLDTL